MASNTTVADDGTVIEDGFFSFLGPLQHFDFMLLEVQLVGSAIGIIYLAAHASLRRPPSAAVRKDKKTGKQKKEDENLSQGLEMSDALVFPLIAGCVLVGLYYLIQYLNDPAILSTILKYYMTFVSLASIATMYAHGMDLGTSLVFPKYWRGRDGRLRKAEQSSQTVVVCDDVGNVVDTSEKESANPLPLFFSILAPTKKAKAFAWKLRGRLTQSWLVKLYVRGGGEEQTSIKLVTLLSIPLALITAALYFTTDMPFLSNTLGYAMCYSSLLIISPTHLLIGTLLLVGLFFYDIFMVFYTPYMVTVATTLDVPIKLTYKAAGRQSILGLGDIVIPGMVMAWALRLDLWMFYERKIKHEATDLKIVEKDSKTGEITTRTDTKFKEVKASYMDVTGRWGERLWTRGTMFLRGAPSLPVELAATQFPKTYFHATVVGYLAGMVVTLSMLLVYKRGQPALLYLVPGVLGAIYATALARGELNKVWRYTEDGSLDTADVVVDVDEHGNTIKAVGILKDGIVDTTKSEEELEKEKEEAEKKERAEREKKEEAAKQGYSLFSLSLEVPPEDSEE